MTDEEIAELRRQHKSIGVGRGVRDEPEHGTYARVVSKKYPCKPMCDACKEANSLYRAKWRKTPAGRRQQAKQQRRQNEKLKASRPKIKQFWIEVKQMTESNRRNT